MVSNRHLISSLIVCWNSSIDSRPLLYNSGTVSLPIAYTTVTYGIIGGFSGLENIGAVYQTARELGQFSFASTNHAGYVYGYITIGT